MENTSFPIPLPESAGSLNIGMVGTVRHDDESWTRYLLTIPQALYPLRCEHQALPVISIRHPLGRCLLGKKVGDEVRYVDKSGRQRRAWLEGIEDEPVRPGKGRLDMPRVGASLPIDPWQAEAWHHRG